MMSGQPPQGRIEAYNEAHWNPPSAATSLNIRLDSTLCPVKRLLRLVLIVPGRTSRASSTRTSRGSFQRTAHGTLRGQMAERRL